MAKQNKKRTDFGPSGPLKSNPFVQLIESSSTKEATPPAIPSPSMPTYRVGKTRRGGWPITIEKRSRGKTVTVVRNVSGDADALLSILKKRCGAGGVVREGEIEVQGEHAEVVEAILEGR